MWDFSLDKVPKKYVIKQNLLSRVILFIQLVLSCKNTQLEPTTGENLGNLLVCMQKRFHAIKTLSH